MGKGYIAILEKDDLLRISKFCRGPHGHIDSLNLPKMRLSFSIDETPFVTIKLWDWPGVYHRYYIKRDDWLTTVEPITNYYKLALDFSTPKQIVATKIIGDDAMVSWLINTHQDKELVV